MSSVADNLSSYMYIRQRVLKEMWSVGEPRGISRYYPFGNIRWSSVTPHFRSITKKASQLWIICLVISSDLLCWGESETNCVTVSNYCKKIGQNWKYFFSSSSSFKNQWGEEGRGIPLCSAKYFFHMNIFSFHLTPSFMTFHQKIRKMQMRMALLL